MAALERLPMSLEGIFVRTLDRSTTLDRSSRPRMGSGQSQPCKGCVLFVFVSGDLVKGAPFVFFFFLFLVIFSSNYGGAILGTMCV